MFSRRTALKRLDNRTLAARTLNRTVRELSEHVGDDPTPPQLLPTEGPPGSTDQSARATPDATVLP